MMLDKNYLEYRNRNEEEIFPGGEPCNRPKHPTTDWKRQSIKRLGGTIAIHVSFFPCHFFLYHQRPSWHTSTNHFLVCTTSCPDFVATIDYRSCRFWVTPLLVAPTTNIDSSIHGILGRLHRNRQCLLEGRHELNHCMLSYSHIMTSKRYNLMSNNLPDQGMGSSAPVSSTGVSLRYHQYILTLDSGGIERKTAQGFVEQTVQEAYREHFLFQGFENEDSYCIKTYLVVLTPSLACHVRAWMIQVQVSAAAALSCSLLSLSTSTTGRFIHQGSLHPTFTC